MEHQLTHELLHYLKSEGYTMLVGEGQADWEEHVYTPVEWDVAKFIESTHSTSYDDHAIVIIDVLLKVDFQFLYMHRVLIQ